jgi:hypothetical protein
VNKQRQPHAVIADAEVLAGRIEAGYKPAPDAKPAPAAVVAGLVFLTIDVSKAAKGVAGSLLNHLNWKDGRCDPSILTMGREAGCAKSNVHVGLNQLGALNVVIRDSYGSACSHRNAYRFDWREIGKIYQQRLVLRPRRSRSRNQDRAQSGNRDTQSPEIDTQTFIPNPNNSNSDHAPLTADLLGSIASRPAQHGQAGWSRQPGQLFRAQATAGGGTSADIFQHRRRDATRASAEARWDRDLRRDLSQEGYACAIESITPELQDEATQAEIKRPGSGAPLVLAQLRLQQFLSATRQVADKNDKTDGSSPDQERDTSGEELIER